MLSEGYCDDRIFVVGNSVVDATNDALKRAKDSTIFDRYPLLHE
jgi:UDP-N-acetylglucosamine 2-epimerase